MNKIKWLWHEPSNMMALADCSEEYLPLMTVCDDNWSGINPFYSYPLKFLKSFGWVELGDF
jgi:hypothetical protein